MLYVGMVNMCYASSNRTFMELKFRSNFFGSWSAISSNRTFMELK